MGAHNDLASVFQDQLAVPVQQHGDPIVEPVGFIQNGAVVEGQGLVLVVPHLVLEALIVRPPLQDRLSVVADPDDLDPQRLKLVVLVTVPATFDRSTRGAGGGEEPHHRRLSQQILARTRGAIL